ncbi:hypothetical protein U1Q18_028551 [Sarracenia purpurea var. burkii]
MLPEDDQELHRQPALQYEPEFKRTVKWITSKGHPKRTKQIKTKMKWNKIVPVKTALRQKRNKGLGSTHQQVGSISQTEGLDHLRLSDQPTSETNRRNRNKGLGTGSRKRWREGADADGTAVGERTTKP